MDEEAHHPEQAGYLRLLAHVTSEGNWAAQHVKSFATWTGLPSFRSLRVARHAVFAVDRRRTGVGGPKSTIGRPLVHEPAAAAECVYPFRVRMDVQDDELAVPFVFGPKTTLCKAPLVDG